MIFVADWWFEVFCFSLLLAVFRFAWACGRCVIGLVCCWLPD